MTPAKFFELVLQSLRRNWRDLTLSSVGIVVGVAALVLFTSLGAGIKAFVLNDVFVVQRLEVVPKQYTLGEVNELFGGEDSGHLGDETLRKLRSIDGVEAAYPKMKLTFPSSLEGGEQLLGRDVRAELVADGIPPRLVRDEELAGDLAFRDWEAEHSCGEDRTCGPADICRGGTCEARDCSGEQACDAPAYCDEEAGRCRMPIPVIASPRMLEIYNSNLNTAMGGAAGELAYLPELSAGQLVGFQFTGRFGESHLGESATGEPFARRLKLVGFSERAIPVGVTMPLGYVDRFNRRFSDEDRTPSYHSIVVDISSNADVASVAREIRQSFDRLTLSDSYEQARQTSFLILMITLVFNLVALVILVISAINIMHTFLMLILDRRRELGLMRAVGATQWNVRALVFGESTAVGAAAGIAGCLVATAGMWGIDYLFAHRVPAFPFKPETLFLAQPWMYGAGVAAAVVFCWLGALLPAFRASEIDPARTLTGR